MPDSGTPRSVRALPPSVNGSSLNKTDLFPLALLSSHFRRLTSFLLSRLPTLAGVKRWRPHYRDRPQTRGLSRRERSVPARRERTERVSRQARTDRPVSTRCRSCPTCEASISDSPCDTKPLSFCPSLSLSCVCFLLCLDFLFCFSSAFAAGLLLRPRLLLLHSWDTTFPRSPPLTTFLLSLHHGSMWPSFLAARPGRPTML
jgi:hypothetical protein